MCYREATHYTVLCDHCGLTAPAGTGWRTPSHADRAALDAGWEMTWTEHLCPLCAIVVAAIEVDGAGGVGPDRVPLWVPAAPSRARRPDICWPPDSTAAPSSWGQMR